ncbi:hypothetical protein, partial [Rheinheimera sp.]|uniref:hypothetical protein n=1 Tax=Rheinheimera sp. TaxID=1869214 RepID=UPI00307E3F75
MQPTGFESIWAELKLSLEWHQEFSLFFVLVQNTKAAHELRQRVSDYMRSHSKPLRFIKANTPADLPHKVIQTVFNRPEVLHQPIWLELTTLDDTGLWDQLRGQTLATLNKRRSQLENTIQSPVFIELPYKNAADIVSWAPDLWSIRQQIIEVINWSEQTRVEENQDFPLHSNTEALPSTQLAEALGQARSKIQKLHSADTAQKKRNLSIALDELGALLEQTQQLPEAKAAFTQSLEICQQLQQSLGDSPQVLRDLSVSFDKV